MSRSSVESAAHRPQAVSGRAALLGSKVRFLGKIGWPLVSIGLFAGLWELAWAVGWINPLLLPPPHIFLRQALSQGRYFDLGARMGRPPPGDVILAVLSTTGISALRVLAGLVVSFVLSIAVGLAIRVFGLFGKLVLPTLTALSPISPVAWLPVAIVLFGIGNAASIFLVAIAIFFVMTLATIAEIDRVRPAFIDVGRNLGASNTQMIFQIILPAILPRLFVLLRINLFAAWMVVLIAEAVGVHSGLGQVIMVARNTFNSGLSFLAMTIIGIVGYAMDVLLGQIQRNFLYWKS
jgi:NitT/TauT family transport system permease protein